MFKGIQLPVPVFPYSPLKSKPTALSYIRLSAGMIQINDCHNKNEKVFSCRNKENIAGKCDKIMAKIEKNH